MILKRFATRIEFPSRFQSNLPPEDSFCSLGSIGCKRTGFIQHHSSAGTVQSAFVGAILWTSNNFEAWIQVRLIPWGWSAMALSLNWRRSFETATRHQGFTDVTEELNISQSATMQQVRLLDGHAGKKSFIRLLRRASMTESKHRLCMRVAGGLALPGQSFADDWKSWASTVDVSCSTGFP